MNRIVKEKIQNMLNTEKVYYGVNLRVPKYDNSTYVSLMLRKSKSPSGNAFYEIFYDGCRMYYSYRMKDLRSIEEEYVHYRNRGKNNLKIIFEVDQLNKSTH
jgi:hypothetical protein